MPSVPSIATHWRQLFEILSQLKGRGHTIEEMATARGCDLKTIRRDIQRLRQLGFTVQSRTEKFGLKVWRVVAPLKTIRKLI